MTLARRVLLALAVSIALIAWLDPSYAARPRPRVALIDATSNTTSGVVSVAARLGEAVAVTDGRDAHADHWVVVADDEEAQLPDPPTHASLSLITLTPTTPALVVESLEAPARVISSTRVSVVATFAARGLAGHTSALVVRTGLLELGRIAHRWTGDERFTARFEIIPTSTGVNHLVVEAVDGAGRSRRSRADTVVTVDDTPLPVLVFEGRPSWTTTFARRALEADARFAVTSASRVSRNIVSRSEAGGSSARAPAARIERLTTSALAPFPTVIVGAPDALSPDETAALRAFAAQGGSIVLAPDRRPTGSYVSLLANAALDEQLLEKPRALPLPASPDLALLASELVHTRTLPAGARAIGVTDGGAEPEARTTTSIWTLPIAEGQLLFVGALDAWRFRGRSGDGFDRWWRQVVEWLARQSTGALTLDCEPCAVEPGARVSVRATVRAADSARGAVVRASIAGPTAEMPVRLWPDAEPGTFTGTLNAPTTPGVYAVSARGARSDEPAESTARTFVVVDAAARRARGADDRWRAATASRGGVVASRDQIDRILRVVRNRATAQGEGARAAADRVWPMRSPWWLLPFAACLGGEWWLRRRGGLR